MSSSGSRPPWTSPAPIRGGGACDSSVLPKIRVQVLQNYRNRGAIAAERSPESQRFSIVSRCTCSLSLFGRLVFLIFPCKSVLNIGVIITLYPINIIRISGHRTGNRFPGKPIKTFEFSFCVDYVIIEKRYRIPTISCASPKLHAGTHREVHGSRTVPLYPAHRSP